MVKANAYGHGLIPIVDYCFCELQLKSFGVARLEEALELRRVNTRYEYELYVFSDLGLPKRWEDYLNFKLLPVVAHRDDLEFVLSHPRCRHLPLVLYFDTGMNRLGLPLDQTASLARQIKRSGRPIYHLMTHFSDSFLPQREKTQLQYQKFLQLKSDLSASGIPVEKTSVANSAAIENGVGLQETAVRPGLMLYGMQSTVGPPATAGQGHLLSPGRSSGRLPDGGWRAGGVWLHSRSPAMGWATVMYFGFGPWGWPWQCLPKTSPVLGAAPRRDSRPN